jgi:hypothetical protein
VGERNKFGWGGGVHRRIALVQQWRRDAWRQGGRTTEQRLYHAQMPQTGFWRSDAVQNDFVVEGDRYLRGVERDNASGVTELTHGKKGGGMERWNDVNAAGGRRQTG